MGLGQVGSHSSHSLDGLAAGARAGPRMAPVISSLDLRHSLANPFAESKSQIHCYLMPMALPVHVSRTLLFCLHYS